jgi:hypothetical protein
VPSISIMDHTQLQNERFLLNHSSSASPGLDTFHINCLDQVLEHVFTSIKTSFRQLPACFPDTELNGWCKTRCRFNGNILLDVHPFSSLSLSSVVCIFAYCWVQTGWPVSGRYMTSSSWFRST